MIKGVVLNETQQVLRALEDSPFEFYLTGSRFFGNFRQDSDYDFFVDENIVPWLIENGFERLPTHNYLDLLTVSVFQKGNVHIQVVKDVVLKSRVQQLIKETIPGIYFTFNKTNHSLLWNLVIKAATS